MPKIKTQNKLDLDYYESVIAFNALTDETYLASVIDVAEPEYFKNNNIKIIFNQICDYYKTRNTIPNTTELKAKLASDKEKQALKDVVKSFKKIDTKYNQEELYENTERFFRERAVYNAVLNTVDRYSKESDVNASEVLSTFESACNISLVDNLGHDYLYEIDKHIADINKTNDYLSTGYSWLDKRLGGGLLSTGRALYVFSGCTNAGKSIVLGNVGTNIISNNKVVIIISLEMPEIIYAQRVSSQLSRIPLYRLKDESHSLKDFVEKYKQQHEKSRLFIKEYPPKSVTVNTIKAYIKKLISKKGIEPDAIIVDYVNLIKPSIVTGNSYIDIKLVSEELRAMSYTFKVPVISATQLNRSAFEEVNPGMQTTSESMGLTHTADFQASIWSDESDKELGILHMGIQKNRFGPNYGQNAFRIDYDTLAIEEMEDEYVDNTQVSDATDSLDQLLGNK